MILASSAPAASQAAASSASARPQQIVLKDVSVEYLLLTEDQRTLKGRILGAFGGGSANARFWALQNIDLSVAQGQVVGVVGRNGSGKSTLLRVIAQVIEPTLGTVEVKGRVTPLLELGGAFHPELTGRENFYLNGSIFRLHREELDRMVPEILAFSELGMFFDMPIKSYSSGMMSRLAFSIATQVEPDILLVDEVLSVGDEQFQTKSYFRIKKLIEKGRIVVMVSHNSAVIEQHCNRVVYLSKGKVIDDGAPREVLARYSKDAAQM